MPQQSQISPMQQYMSTYGDRLSQLLNGSMTPDQARQNPTAPVPVPGAPPGSELRGTAPPAPGAPPGQQPNPMAAPAAPGGGDSSFKAHWDQSTPADQKKATDGLEQELKKGNQTIDSAYDDLVKQMGTRPDGKHLSREEKGQMLMEFGLSLMANSGRKAYGTDTGAAIGASAGDTLAHHQNRLEGQQAEYDKRRLDIEGKRADAKSELSKQDVLEGRSENRDERRTARENSQIASTITQPDNTVVGVTKGGQASELTIGGPGGKKVQQKPKPPAAGAPGGRPLAEDRRYSQYMEIYGKDVNGKPLTGQALETVKKRALQFSADPKQSTFSDAEIRNSAERSIDNFMKSNWASFRDMTPEQAQQWRNENADKAYERLKAGEVASEVVPPNPGPPPANRPGRGSGGGSQLGPVRKPTTATPRSFKSESEIGAALDSGQIQKGDVVQMGGKSFRVQ